MIHTMTDLVLQEETTGCGFACVAMVAGKSYAEVKTLANQQGMHATDEALYTTTNYVRRLLAELDVELGHGETKFEDWQSLPDVALLATKYRVEDGAPRWHWSVYTASPQRVLDPAAYLEVNERTDFENIEVEWFIPCSR